MLTIASTKQGPPVAAGDAGTATEVVVPGVVAPEGVLIRSHAVDRMLLTFAGVFTRFALRSALPDHGRSATFYNFWTGSPAWPSRFRARLAHDLGAVLALVSDGTVSTEIAARLPIAQAGEALALAEARTPRGKVILEP